MIALASVRPDLIEKGTMPPIRDIFDERDSWAFFKNGQVIAGYADQYLVRLPIGTQLYDREGDETYELSQQDNLLFLIDSIDLEFHDQPIYP